MIRRASPRLGAYAGLSALGLIAALVLGRPELVVLAEPFALLLAVGLVLGRAPRLALACTIDAERALEGDEIHATIAVRADTPVERLEVLLALPYGLREPPAQNPATLRLAAGEERTLELTITCERWGGDVPGEVYVPGARPAGALDLGGGARPAHAPEGLPAARAAARPDPPARDAGLRRQPGRAGQGRRDRVRRHPPLHHRATAFAASTGARAPAAATSSSTRCIPSGTRT